MTPGAAIPYSVLIALVICGVAFVTSVTIMIGAILRQLRLAAEIRATEEREHVLYELMQATYAPDRFGEAEAERHDEHVDA